MIPLLPAAIVLLAGGAYASQSSRDRQNRGVLTPERKLVFETAINEVKDVNKLKALAKAFDEQGLPHYADLLNKRANLRTLSPEIKAARKDAYRKAMRSDKPEAIRQVAAAFDRDGANGAANSLRQYADSLVKKSQEVPQNITDKLQEKAAQEEPKEGST